MLRFSFRSFLVLGLFSSLGLMQGSAVEPGAAPAPFHPPGMWTWDNWFVQEGGKWHAFYLQLPESLGWERRWKNNDPFKHVGHAVSTDLRHWQDQGPALTAMSGTWNDRHIATGSIIRHSDEWWMFFTGRGHGGDGLGLAKSQDLMTWKTEPKPLFPLIDTFGDGKEVQGFKATWQGREVRWAGISDPYVLPEKVNGRFYLVLCSRILGEPLATSGCLTLLESADLLTWTHSAILAWPGCFERMETPQLWQKDGRWYLYFGGVINAEIRTGADAKPGLPAAVRGRKSHLNYVYASESFEAVRRDDQLHFIETPPGHFIMKVLAQEQGLDLALYTVKEGQSSSLSKPYPVTYLPEGGVKLEW